MLPDLTNWSNRFCSKKSKRLHASNEAARDIRPDYAILVIV
jgi:hypothetical protein